jgi:FkbM family methyltransferase
METRDNLLKFLKKTDIFLKEFQENYKGTGLLKKFKRLIRYRSQYLRYCFFKLFNKSRLIKTKTFWGEDFLIDFRQGEYFQHNYFILPEDKEIKLTKFFIKNLKENSVFYDIGANVGYYSLLAKQIIQIGEVHSFEPVSEIFKILKENLSKKQNIFLNQLALFNKEGQIDFYDTIKISSVGSAFNPALLRNHDLLVASKKIKVQTTTLDKYCYNYSRPDFLKIDVEGAEREVIEGGIKILKETNPIIAMEVWRKPLDNTSHLKAIAMLYNLDYKSYKIINEGELELIKKIHPEKDILEKDTSDNFIFKKL